MISPGTRVVVDGVELSAPPTGQPGGAATAPAETGGWGPARREVLVGAAGTERVLVVPESVNPGWVANTEDGTRLSPVVVNGWQQGWVLPAGTAGTVTLAFRSNPAYRGGLAGGLALVPLLVPLALWRRRRVRDAAAARPWRPGRWAVPAALGVGAVIAGVTGAIVFAAGLVLGRRSERLTVGLSAGGLILAGAVLARFPWRSVDGYAGHSAGVQLLALISVAAVCGAAVRRAGDSPVSAEEIR